jgi:hypothetical protein
MSLGERIVGTWQLIRCISRTADGTEFYPQGEDLEGLLVYSHDGYVSVNLMQPGRPLLPPGTEPRLAPDAEIGPLARGYMAYAGPYRVDEEAQIIHHKFEMCLDPGMIDTPQPRIARFIGDQLELSVPTSALGRRNRSVHLLWRRP